MSQNWTLKRTSSPSGLAVSLQEAKDHLRISGTGQDDHLTLLIEASTEKLERDINRGIISATWQQAQDQFPSNNDPMMLYMGNDTSVSSITYVDENNATQTLDSADYSYSSSRSSVFCESTDGWPSTSKDSKSDKVFINFSCGVVDEGCVPRLMKQAILLEVGRAYFDPAQENQGNTDNGKTYENLVLKLIRSSYP